MYVLFIEIESDWSKFNIGLNLFFTSTNQIRSELSIDLKDDTSDRNMFYPSNIKNEMLIEVWDLVKSYKEQLKNLQDDYFPTDYAEK